MLPRRPILITSPRRDGLVGSPMRQKSGRRSRSRSHATTRTVPSTALPSSSPVISRLIVPAASGGGDARWAATAAMKAATAPFMSQAPRPNSMPFRTVPANGSTLQPRSGPGGTTSVCPAKQTCGEPAPSRANRFGVSRPAGPNGKGVTVKPSAASRPAISACAPPSSSPVTERQATSAHATGSGSNASPSASPATGTRLNRAAVH